RGVPEAVELLARSGGDRGMDVPEPDHRDPASEVEVAAPVGADEPAALALDERDVGAGVGREHRRARDDAHGTTAVRPISARTPSRAARTAASSFGTIPPANAPPSSRRSASAAPSSG